MTPSTGVISGIRISHDRASLDDVAAACHDDQQDTIAALASEPEVSEAFVLQTCNRFEAYVVTDAPATGRAVLADFVPDVTDIAAIEMSHEESLRHLLRVAAGLESLVLGEDQIIGQVRDAYASAQAIGAVGPMLEEALTKSIHVGERARTETAINEGVVSVGSAAVALATDQLTLEGATALVVGAGEMGTIASHAFSDSGIETLIVANRSIERAETVAEDVSLIDTRAVGLGALPACLPRADVVVTATGSDGHVLDTNLLGDCGETLVVDIAQPRDVSPAVSALDGVTVHDMGALESVTDETRARRRAAAESVETIVDREFENLLEQYKRKRADEVIAGMYAGAEQVKERELETALSRLESEGLNEDQREIVESMADALVSQLLAPPTKSLRDAAANDDWTTINTALQLFDPEFHDEPPAFVAEHLESAADD